MPALQRWVEVRLPRRRVAPGRAALARARRCVGDGRLDLGYV